MSNTVICLNNNCLKVNPINNKFCDQCGGKLLLRERYQAVELIGQGGFGRTFLAKDFDKPSKPYCVIKQFFPSAQGTDNIEKASALFAQEAERLEELGKHPQIPELFAYFVTDDGQQYLVQEYIAGENLQTELVNHGVYKESEVKELLIEILNILKFVHSNNIIHRDIKPDNIIRRTSDQKLVLVDFGAAKYITSQSALNVTGTVIGAAQYCSPEQARGKPIFASDLYSLGVTCIHLLTLVDPFELFDISENDWVWRNYLVNNPVSDQFSQVLDQLIAVGLKKRFTAVDQVFNSLNYQYSSPPSPATVAPTKYEKIQQLLGEVDEVLSCLNYQYSSPPRPEPVLPTKYEKLKQLLAAGEWKAADQETAMVMLQVAGREKAGWLDRESIEKFPCEDLRTIDQLWVKYSNGRFGFSMQKNIWLECGGKVDYGTECKLGDRIGWRVQGKWIDYDEGTFSSKAPIGYFPWIVVGFFIGGSWWVSFWGLGNWGAGHSCLASRALSCNIYSNPI